MARVQGKKTAHRPKKTRARAARAKPAALPTPTHGDVPWLTVVGARQNNLRDITVDIPLGRFVCVTGVSGSGKSSLVNEIIREALARDLNGSTKANPGEHDCIDGLDHLDKVIDIDQSPIGRTPRSNPATYIKVFDEIRALYTRLPDARVRGYKPGRFSFNVATGKKGGGRCEACEGNGSNRVEMDFLADIWVTCPVCGGKRFNRETLQILYKGKGIADVLNMDVQEALAHFEPVPRIAHMLRTLHDVGLDYVKLGQSSTTLSGGEAQRIKLARELVKKSTGRTLYLLDEPTTGLHFDDIRKLLDVLHGFVDAGNTVLVIEHNLDVVKTADWVIDLGPEGGAAGGRVVVAGTPETVAVSKRSYTGGALKDVLEPVRKGRTGTNGVKKRLGGKRTRTKATAGDAREITVVGAKQHNLKDVTVSIPRGKSIVFTGPSGSGKTSLAIDTIYSEGQRRYVESLSAYARQFLSRMQPPRVDHVHGLSPAICIEQKSASKSPRSTVGTITEIYDYMRVLWARIGQPYCPDCRLPIGTQSSDEIVERILGFGEGARVILMAPVEPTGNESYQHLFERERASGYARVRVDGVVHELDAAIDIDRKQAHEVALVIDRVVVRKNQASRIADSVEQGLSVGNGVIFAQLLEESSAACDGGMAGTGERKTKKSGTKRVRGKDGRDKTNGIATPGDYRFSQHHSCEQCGRSFDELTPHHFSFNSRLGWCDACEGLGLQKGATPAAIVVHPTQSIADGAIAGWSDLRSSPRLSMIAHALADFIGFDLHTPWHQIPETQRLMFLHGCGDHWIEVTHTRSRDTADLRGLRFQWHGFFPAINRATRSSWQYRKRLEDLVTDVPCDACAGGRLKPEPAASRLESASIYEVCLWPLGKTLEWFDGLPLDARQRKIAGELMHEITSRLRFLVDVGLDYVSLHRTASTLSGGESQRIQLASQIGTGLTGVLYVLDEPTIGLHPRDNNRLVRALNRLRDLGNTLVVVEHDREIIEAADHLVDFGPGAGSFGGEVTAAGSPGKLRKSRKSLTGRYLANNEAIEVPTNRRPVSDRGVGWLTVHGARENNLREIDVTFPLGRFTCVTGVSGSGKSSLVTQILYNGLASRIHRARLVAGGHERIEGVEQIDKVINVDQTPIGNSPTSNPATYTGLFDAIRELFAKLPLSKIRGYPQNRFSFNRPGGRCEACEGMGQQCIEMHFLPDVWVECENCGGSRYVTETLEVQYRGKSIADVLKMRVSAALELFEGIPKVRRMLTTLDDVGLGYVELGQSAPTLSGGEAQRVKLAAELGRPSTGKTLYILDEPTTGLHFDDLKKLLAVLHRLVDLGNTCICIEHNLDVIKTADWIIDLGPEAGEDGGIVIAEGTPEAIVELAESHTGRALEPMLRAGPHRVRRVHDPSRQDDLQKTLSAPIDLGADVKMPWERNGREWHTVNHVDHKGESVEWDPQLLVWIVETIEKLGTFAPTDWNHRTRIDMRASGRSEKEWFCHILTGSKDLLELAIRVRARTFTDTGLQKQLGIKMLDERRDLPIYGQWDRIKLRTPHPGWQEVRLHLRDFVDVNKRSFKAFLNRAVQSYEKLVSTEKPASAAESEEPWKTLGMQWHLSQRGINRRHAIRWSSAVLVALVGRLKAIHPGLEFAWSTRTAGHFSVPGEGFVAGKIVTNMGRGLRVELRAPSNVVTPAMIDKLGDDSDIKRTPGYDRVVFWMRSLSQIDTKQLRRVWQMCRVEAKEERLQSA